MTRRLKIKRNFYFESWFVPLIFSFLFICGSNVLSLNVSPYRCLPRKCIVFFVSSSSSSCFRPLRRVRSEEKILTRDILCFFCLSFCFFLFLFFFFFHTIRSNKFDEWISQTVIPTTPFDSRIILLDEREKKRLRMRSPISRLLE